MFLRKNRQQTAEKMDAGVLEDEVVSMVDVLHEDNELEEEARAVLGDSDDQHCTYITVSSFKLSLQLFLAYFRVDPTLNFRPIT